jgi:hypothetical protein
MRSTLAALVLVLAAVSTAAADERDALARARAAYNEGCFDEAITDARQALAVPADANAARLVLARSLLERYRERAMPADLSDGRDMLRAVDAARLSVADRAELVVGLGQWLFFTDRFGAAAELFASALAHPALDAGARDRLLDWWASAIDRQAQSGTAARTQLYARILERMDRELVEGPASVAASYWLVAAVRGLGDFERAWQAALAGWVRASLLGEVGDALRADLDRLVLTAVIPDRARAAAGPRGSQREAADTMVTEWERFKLEWEPAPNGSTSRR